MNVTPKLAECILKAATPEGYRTVQPNPSAAQSALVRLQKAAAAVRRAPADHPPDLVAAAACVAFTRPRPVAEGWEVTGAVRQSRGVPAADVEKYL